MRPFGRQVVVIVIPLGLIRIVVVEKRLLNEFSGCARDFAQLEVVPIYELLQFAQLWVAELNCVCVEG